MITALAALALVGWLCAVVLFVEARDRARHERSTRDALRVINQSWRAVVDDIVTSRSRIVLRTDDQHVLVVALPVQHEIDYTQTVTH